MNYGYSNKELRTLSLFAISHHMHADITAMPGAHHFLIQMNTTT